MMIIFKEHKTSLATALTPLGGVVKTAGNRIPG
jgi:hypothetical protein